MKFNCLLLLVLAACLTSAAHSQTKRALIIAIGNYSRPDGNGWPQISSLNDVKYIKAALQKQGFADGNIKAVEDAQATVAGLNNAFNELIRSVKPGDVVVIHVSSHGEQVEDDNSDEPDGLDETIVAYDAVLPTRSDDFKKDQASYFRDDAFGDKISQLRAALGKNGDIVVFMDCCHSGSGTRGPAAGKPRGNQPPLTSKGFKRPANAGAPEEVFRDRTASRGDESALATYVVFSAAKAEQLNYETFDDVTNAGMGSLTYAVSKTFGQLDPSSTYRSVFARIKAIMHEKVPGQEPVMEGNGGDRALFGGRFVEQKPYVEIEDISGTDLRVRAGLFAGLDSGAVVAVYPSGTTDTTGRKALAKGRVYKAENYASFVKLDKDAGLKEPALGWVFISEPVYKFNPVTVQINPAASRGRTAAASFSAAEASSIRSAFSSMPLVSFKGAPQLVLVKGTAADSIYIASNGHLYKTVPNSGNNIPEIRKAVAAYVQYKFLQEFNINDPAAMIDIRLVPVINGVADTAQADAKLVNGKYEFKVGDKFAVWARNTGTQDAYFNILDMQPDGVINRVLPNKTKRIYPSDLVVAAGKSRLFDKFPVTVGPPYGTEVFKVFVSTQEIDMESIATTRGIGQRTNFTVLEQVVRSSYNGARGTEAENISNADGSTYSLLFAIKEK